MTTPFSETLETGLYIISTPIGNLRDITLRALDVLKSCDYIACEDTRVSQKLLSAYDIAKPFIVYHDHNADETRSVILQKLAQGQRVALISDAGTPLVSDPGYKLVQACQEAGHRVHPVPGPSSVLAALVISGQPSDRFAFLGFFDEHRLSEQKNLPMTLIFFESARRLVQTLSTLSQHMPDRSVSVVRELTKIYEEVTRGPLEEVMKIYQENGKDRGEIVLVLSPPKAMPVSEQELDAVILDALKTHSLKDACVLVAGSMGLPKKQVYKRALEITQSTQ